MREVSRGEKGTGLALFFFGLAFIIVSVYMYVDQLWFDLSHESTLPIEIQVIPYAIWTISLFSGLLIMWFGREVVKGKLR